MSTVAGIDIGGDALKGVVLRRSNKGATEIVSAGALPLGDLSFMEESDDKTLAICEKLKELVRSARLKAPQRRVGVSGSNTSIRYIQVPPVPPWRLEMLVKYDVEERASEKEGNAYDYRILDVPETGGQYTVMIGMCRETAANELLAVGKSSGLGEIEIDLEALALYNAYYHGHGFDSDKTVVVLDVGANDITILICRNGALYFARTMLGGGQRFTHALAEDLKIDQAEAEQLKKTYGEITFDVSPVAGRTNARIPRPGATNVGMRPNATGIMQRLAKGDGGDVAADSGSAKKPGDVSKFTAPKPGAPKPAASSPSIPNISLTPASISLTPAPISLSGPAPTAPAGASSSSSLSLEDEFSSLAGLEREAAAQPEAQAAAVVEAPRTEAPAPKQGPVMMPAKLPDALELELPETPKAEEQPVAPKPAPSAPIVAGPPKAAVIPAMALSLDLDGGPNEAAKPVEPEVKPETAESAPTVVETPSDELGAAPKAEEPKPEMDEKRKRQISAALVREAASLCAALENALTFAKQQTKMRELKADRVYITGGGSKLKGLPEFMSRRLRMEVVPLEPLKMLSLNRLDPAQAEALKAEQHTMAVAIGLGIGELQKGTFSFLLWPQAVKDRKVFWSRGAYVYYAAASLAAAVGLTLFTPYSNASALQSNMVVANEANSKAKQLDAELHGLITKNEEKRAQLKQISDNTSSGHFFLNLLGELKSKLRITDDIYLTSLTTTLPQVIMAAHGDGTRDGAPAIPSKSDTRSAKNAEPADTFQTQRRVFLRGFVRSHNQNDLIDKLIDFYHKRLVPYPLEPDNPANLFKDIRTVWISPGDTQNEGFFLKEFVLEAWTDGTREVKNEKAPTTPAKGGAKAGQKVGAQPANPAQPAEAAPAPRQPAVQPNVAPPAKGAPPAAVQPVEAVPAQPVAPQPRVNQPNPATPAPAAPPAKKKFILPSEQAQ